MTPLKVGLTIIIAWYFQIVSWNEELYGSIRNCPDGTCEIPVMSTGIDY